MKMKLSCSINFVGIYYLAIMMSLACFGDSVWYDDDCLDGYCEEPLYCLEEVPRRQWIVTNSSQAQTLAQAVRCSGEVFEVEWDGSVVINETFVVVNGTVLNVYGSGPTATIDGNDITRIFTVVNASLSLSNITLANGAAVSGGAIAAVNSTLSFRQTTFEGNTAYSNGGALLISNDSSASFDGNTTLWGNTAGENGGAMYVSGGSDITLFGDAMFCNNTAANGGAIFATGASNISLRGESVFYGNIANSVDEGGGGGAIFVGDGAEVRWDGVTNFTSNTAFWDGGAMAASSTTSVSRILIRGPSRFINNTCRGNGGGMSLRAVSSVSFGAMEVIFSSNSARFAGGALFISEMGSETALFGVAFEENFAQVGGAVYTSESQSTVIIDECRFVGNAASFSGGAMENAGRSSCSNTSFVGNEASIGGALRLAGTTWLYRCSFMENISEEGEGAAISNIGIISTFSNITFVDNMYNCDRGDYLDFDWVYSEEGEGICSGCPSCYECVTDSTFPFCVGAPEHTWSPGGTTTLEGLDIDPGYWRATTTSRDILECHNPSACPGGLTGFFNLCAEGYEGALCSICSEGYREGRDKTCMKCSDGPGGIFGVVIFFVVVGIVLLTLYKLSGTMELLCGGFVQRLVRHVPFQSIRIIFVTWQILKQIASSTATSYSDIYDTFLNIIAVFNFDLGWVLSMDCIVELDFHQRMLLTTLGSNVVLALLGMSYVVAAIRYRDSETSLQSIRDKLLGMVLLVTFLVYASVSSVLIPMFSCDDFGSGKRYLRADYNIDCDGSTHRSLQIYAGFMILLYPVGVPMFYSWLLFRNRDVLMDGASREDDPRVQSVSDLWEAYKPSRFYYEIIECIRRLAITLTLFGMTPTTTAQISATIMVTFGFGILTEAFDPYDSPWDTWMSRAGYVIDISSMFYALLLDVNPYSLNPYFDVILVVANVCMVLAVVKRELWSVRSSMVYELDGPITERRRNDTRVENEGILVCVETMTGEVRRDVV